MQANAWLNRMSAGALFPLVLWWRSVFSSPLIDFLKLEWTSEQVKHFMVEFDSRYQLEKHQLCWDFIWKFSWHSYFCFPLISADLPPTTRQDLFSYSTQSILSSHVSARLSRSLSPSVWLTVLKPVLLFMDTYISWPLTLLDCILQQSDHEW